MASRIALLGCILCLWTPASQGADLAPPASYEGRTITAVKFEPAVQPLAAAELNRLHLFETGAPLRLSAVRDAIQRLYSTGAYSDIEVGTEPAPKGVVVVVRTTEQWFVGPVDVKGNLNSPPNRGQLANATQLQLGAPFDDSELQTAAKGIRTMLQRNGLYFASVEPRIHRDDEHQEVELTFTVNSGKRARLTLPTVNGDTKIPAAVLAQAAKYKGWFRWKPATEGNVQSGLRNVRKKYSKQDRLTAAVTLERTEYLAPQNRVKAILQANGGPKVKFQTTGAKVSNGKLHRYVPVFDQGMLYRDLLVAGARNLRDYFQSEGYFDAEVEFRESRPSPDLEEITYTVGLGQRQKLVKVSVVGNQYFSTADLRALMFLHPAGFVRLRHGRYSADFAAHDENAIVALYQANGFSDAKVTTTVATSYLGKRGNVAVTLHVDEGPQYTVSKLDVEGITLAKRQKVVSRLAETQGQPYSASNVALDRDAILEFYQGSGYLNADFTWQKTPGPGPHQVALKYTITEGRPNYIKGIVIYGLSTTRRSLVDSEIQMKTGDPISWTEMGNTQRRLYNLGVFDKADMAVQNPDGDTQEKYVLYHVTEGHLYNLALGFGLEAANIGGSQTSLANPAGTAGVSPRVDFDLSRLNLWGLGHSVNFKSRYSTLDRRASLEYLWPRFQNVDGRNVSVSFLYDNTRDVLTYTATRYVATAQISQRFSKSLTGIFRYQWTDDQVRQSTLKISPELIPLYAQTAHVGMFATNWVQDRRNDPVNATRGYYNSLDFGVADHAFGGTVNFTRLLLRSSEYKTVFVHDVIATNTEFGWIQPFNITPGVSEQNYMPLPERFYGGGDNSNRGFPYYQAGPRDPNTGFPIGGNALLFNQTEFRFPFIGENIDGVIFHDMGNVYSTVSDISFRVHQDNLQDFNYMVHAVGFGIRYRTPLGPLALDLAYSINPPKFFGFNGTYQELLSAGVNPCSGPEGFRCSVQQVSHFQFFFSIGQAF